MSSYNPSLSTGDKRSLVNLVEELLRYNDMVVLSISVKNKSHGEIGGEVRE